MNKLTRYPREVRDRAVRMVMEHTEGHGSQWAAISLIAGKLNGKLRRSKNYWAHDHRYNR